MGAAAVERERFAKAPLDQRQPLRQLRGGPDRKEIGAGGIAGGSAAFSPDQQLPVDQLAHFMYVRRR
jgi:hypothetical protein